VPLPHPWPPVRATRRGRCGLPRASPTSVMLTASLPLASPSARSLAPRAGALVQRQGRPGRHRGRGSAPTPRGAARRTAPAQRPAPGSADRVGHGGSRSLLSGGRSVHVQRSERRPLASERRPACQAGGSASRRPATCRASRAPLGQSRAPGVPPERPLAGSNRGVPSVSPSSPPPQPPLAAPHVEPHPPVVALVGIDKHPDLDPAIGGQGRQHLVDGVRHQRQAVRPPHTMRTLGNMVIFGHFGSMAAVVPDRSLAPVGLGCGSPSSRPRRLTSGAIVSPCASSVKSTVP